jgi:hypothetical protein
VIEFAPVASALDVRVATPFVRVPEPSAVVAL